MIDVGVAPVLCPEDCFGGWVVMDVIWYEVLGIVLCEDGR